VSLYLVVFDADGNELEGWVLGHYSDFGAFRDAIVENQESSRYPVLLGHSDCDGEWSVDELPKLKKELQEIGTLFRSLPSVEPTNAFEHTADFRAEASVLYDCFHNVDGENLIEALIHLCEVGIRSQNPILFQ
jgi:hypothetical protein